jgi:hypothetical protein
MTSRRTGAWPLIGHMMLTITDELSLLVDVAFEPALHALRYFFVASLDNIHVAMCRLSPATTEQDVLPIIRAVSSLMAQHRAALARPLKGFRGRGKLVKIADVCGDLGKEIIMKRLIVGLLGLALAAPAP